jgi:tetratricopeptide (TPR) repeat protein
VSADSGVQEAVIVEPAEEVAVKSAAEPVVTPTPVPVVAAPAAEPSASKINFGDHKSSTLTSKAWQALAAKDYDAAIIYTNKCIEMYSSEAIKMQQGLKEYPSGAAENIFSYWALNDVATCLYIQGEAYRKTKVMDKAKAAFERINDDFSYGQTYNVASKTFWKPADGAQDSLYMIEKNLDLNYGNMASNYIVLRMWESLSRQNLEEVIAYDMKLESLYSQVAKDMQTTLTEYPGMPPENIHRYWAVNDVGTGMFILGEAYRMAGEKEKALKAYNKVMSDYSYAQCWDPQGWFWKPAEAAQQKIIEIEAMN